MQKFLSLFAATCALFCATNLAHADVIKSGPMEGAGRAVGFKELLDLGKNADAENKRLKDKSPFYKSLDELAPSNGQAPSSLACTSAFESVIGEVRSRCSGDNSQSDPELINKAKQELIDAGLLSAADFSGVSISWCAGGFTGNGITPGSDEIILHADLKSDPSRTATTLAHEMRHVLQIRRMGSGTYKCDYARYYVKCDGCLDGNHPLEAEAYQFEEHAESVLSGTFISSNSPHVLAGSAITSIGLPVLPSTLPGDLLRSDCKDCFTYLADTSSGIRKHSNKFFVSRRNTRLSLNAERKAKATCSLGSEQIERAVESCRDDMTVIYTEIFEKVVGDYAVGVRHAADNYWKAGEKDIVDACSILRVSGSNVGSRKNRSEKCTLRAKAAVDEMVAYARKKYRK